MPPAGTAGELNYLITHLIGQYVQAAGHSYQTYNDVTGVLDAASKEFYRRTVAPYEDAKRQENGDVECYTPIPKVVFLHTWRDYFGKNMRCGDVVGRFSERVGDELVIDSAVARHYVPIPEVIYLISE